MRWKPYYVLDLSGSAVLPVDWQEQVLSAVSSHGIETVLSGSGSTSREARIGQSIHVRVADGFVVKRELPWLWSLYGGLLKDFCSSCFERPVYLANLLHSAVNINYLEGKGARYEWHVDSNPITGVLFATDSDPGLGGTLVFRHVTGQRALFKPRAGAFICFDAREIPHRVAPLRKEGKRISIPMNYYESAADQLRPPDLDRQIYTPIESI